MRWRQGTGVRARRRGSLREGRRTVRIPGAVVTGALALLAGGAGPTPAGAQTPVEADAGPVSLAEAVRRSTGRHPAVRAAEAGTEAAGARLAQARGAWWPDVTLVGSATQYQKPMVVHPIHGFTPGETPPFDETLLQGGARVGWTVFGDGRSARTRSAGAAHEASRARTRSTRTSIAAGAAGAYLSVLTGLRVLEAHDRRIAALEAERDRARQEHEVGRAPRVQVIRATAELEGARAERVEVASELEVARRRLARFMGASPEELAARGVRPVALADTAAGNRRDWTARAERGSPTLMRARREEDAARATAAVARSARLPDLELGALWMDRGSADGDFLAEWSVGLSASLPLFTGGEVSGEIARAAAESRRAAAATEAVRLDIADAVDEAFSTLEAAQSRLDALRSSLAAAREVARIEKLRLETGASVQPEYLDAEARLLTARARRAEAEHAVIRARIELAATAGELDARWVEEHIRTGGGGA